MTKLGAVGPQVFPLALGCMGMGAGTDHSIIDHCSISWTIDEAFSSRAAKNITLQRCLISEALNVAGHQFTREMPDLRRRRFRFTPRSLHWPLQRSSHAAWLQPK